MTGAGHREAAFSRTDLVAVVGIVALLSLVLLPVLARQNDDAERAVCLYNMKRIMAAVTMYSTDNNGFLPHPSWGSDLTGPDNWCYATANGGRDPGLPAAPQSCAGRDENSLQFSNQVRFFKIGQLAPFLEGQRVLVCPTDWRESKSTKSIPYRDRPQKLTSYSMSGTVGGYVGPRGGSLLPNGRTFKTTDFLPTDILLWEQNETDGFYFNDAAAAPETGGEETSRRHVAANGDGLGVVGRAGARADFVKWTTFTNLQRSVVRPNELLCGPGYQ